MLLRASSLPNHCCSISYVSSFFRACQIGIFHIFSSLSRYVLWMAFLTRILQKFYKRIGDCVIDPLGGIEMFENELTGLLENLFADDDEALTDITVLRGSALLFSTLTTCCTYSYAGYDG